MRQLIEFAKKIKDEELRKKIIEFLKDPSLSHKDFKKYPRAKPEEVKSLFTVSSPQGIATAERGIIEHSIALGELCLKTAETLEKNYRIKLNHDHLLAAAILHDIPKIFEWKKGEEGFEPTGILLDHTMLGVAELYKREFPEEVIHIIASHFGESGPTPPRNFEAFIFHHLDSMLSMTEFYLAPKVKQEPLQFVILDEKMLKEIREKSEKL